MDRQCKNTNYIEDALGQFPDETLLCAFDKLLYKVGVRSFISSSSCCPKDGLPDCCAPKPSDSDDVIAFKSSKGSTTSIITLKSCASSTVSSASRMRSISPCGKREEHFVLERDFKKSCLRNVCHKKMGAIERLISWAKGLPCPKSDTSEACKRSKPFCCKRISCKASSCADAKINIYDDGSKTVEIVERRPSYCLKQPQTILFIGILKDGTAVSFDLPENC